MPFVGHVGRAVAGVQRPAARQNQPRVQDAVREFLRHVRRDRRVGAAHEHFERAAERLLVKAHGFGAGAVEGEIGDGLGQDGVLRESREARQRCRCRLVERRPRESTPLRQDLHDRRRRDRAAAIAPPSRNSRRAPKRNVSKSRSKRERQAACPPNRRPARTRRERPPTTTGARLLPLPGAARCAGCATCSAARSSSSSATTSSTSPSSTRAAKPATTSRCRCSTQQRAELGARLLVHDPAIQIVRHLFIVHDELRSGGWAGGRGAAGQGDRAQPDRGRDHGRATSPPRC